MPTGDEPLPIVPILEYLQKARTVAKNEYAAAPPALSSPISASRLVHLVRPKPDGFDDLLLGHALLQVESDLAPGVPGVGGATPCKIANDGEESESDFLPGLLSWE